MGEGGIKGMYIAFMFIALFAISIISFGYNLAIENDSNRTIMGDSRISNLYSGINSTIHTHEGEGIQSEANTSLYNFNKQDPTEGTETEGLFFSVITGIGRSVMSVVISLYDATLDPVLRATGIPRQIRIVIGSILTSILLFVVVLLAWRLYRTGE